MKNSIRPILLCAAAVWLHGAAAQEPERAVLRFDEIRSEELPDLPDERRRRSPAARRHAADTLSAVSAVGQSADGWGAADSVSVSGAERAAGADPSSVFAEEAAAGDIGAVCTPLSARPAVCKLNRRRVSFAEAYDAVTLWNVRRVRVKGRRMRQSDTTRRERVQLLKFFVERDRRKGARPHLLGNVAGYTWSSSRYDSVSRRWREVPPHIATYTLRAEYDSVRLAGGEVSMFRVPEELWHTLPVDAGYVLDGVEVPGGIFQFIDGLILRTLTVVNPADEPQAAIFRRPMVLGDTYPDRIPLVIFGSRRLSVAEWLRMCRSDAFRDAADLPMRYYYMLPAEAVSLYGPAGRFGAICISLAE